jgi:hypothetical protein
MSSMLLLPLRFLLLLLCDCVARGAGVSWEHSRSSSMCLLRPPPSSSNTIENVFLRNCSAADMHPAFLPTPADIEALGHVLHNRTLAFIGDSTTQSQVRSRAKRE